MKINSRYDNLILFFILLLLMLFAIYYVSVIKIILNDESRAYLKELSEQAKQKVEEKIDSKFELLALVSMRNKEELKNNYKTISHLKDNVIAESGFAEIIFISADGRALVKDDNFESKEVNLKDEKYFISMWFWHCDINSSKWKNIKNFR